MLIKKKKEKRKKTRSGILKHLHKEPSFVVWWHISATTCQILMSSCQIFMLTCQIIVLTSHIFIYLRMNLNKEKPVFTQLMLKLFQQSKKHMTSQHKDLTSQHYYLTVLHNIRQVNINCRRWLVKKLC